MEKFLFHGWDIDALMQIIVSDKDSTSWVICRVNSVGRLRLFISYLKLSMLVQFTPGVTLYYIYIYIITIYSIVYMFICICIYTIELEESHIYQELFSRTR